MKSAFLFSLFLTVSAFAQNDLNRPTHPALLPWQEVRDYVTSPIALDQIQHVNFQCDQTTLYPTHADQTTKIYHQFDYAQFDLGKLKADDRACLMPSKFKNASGQYYCQMGDTYYTAIISDTYKDRCGHVYRGYWRVSYLHQDENMGTLFAKGRTMYPKPNADYPGDVQLGGTYPVEASEFLFFSPLFNGDEAAIQKAFVDNQKTILRYNPQTWLFEER